MTEPFDHPARFIHIPAPGPFENTQVVRELGDGLVLRRASARDADALDGFNRVVHADPPDYADIDGLGCWARDLVDGGHPTVSAEDFWLVEDTAKGRLVSSLVLLPHRLRYDGIPFDAAQVELVGTHPDYRKRGLIRAQMDCFHEASAARGHVMQWICGIPWYYRQFGYEMALETDGARVVTRAALPSAPDAPPELAGPLRMRDARPEDAESVEACLKHGAARLRLSCEVGADYWRWEIEAKSRRNISRRSLHIVEDDSGVRAVVLCGGGMYQNTLRLYGVEVANGTHWSDVAPFILSSVENLGERYAEEVNSGSPAQAGPARFDFVRFELGSEHPLYESSGALERDIRRPYALFIRIPDIAGFLEMISPALEGRLANSPHAGRSGDIDLNFYRSGLRLRFSHGRLDAIEAWEPSTEDLGHHGFPDLTFIQLITGFRSVRDLQYAFPDAMERSADHVSWLEALFPPAASSLLSAS